MFVPCMYIYINMDLVGVYLEKIFWGKPDTCSCNVWGRRGVTYSCFPPPDNIPSRVPIVKALK